MRRARAWLMAAALASLAQACSSDEPAPAAAPAYPLDDQIKLNQLQTKGTHNSYHVQTPGTVILEHQYTHAPLDQQLERQGVRAFELDTRLDKKTGTFVVFHLGIIDEVTTCATLAECLATLASWSRAHPLHHPIFVQIEPKDAMPNDGQEDYFSAFEAVILSQWPRDKIITPDDIKKNSPTLREAVLSGGWPTLGASRGKILFFVNDGAKFREAYTRGQTSLDGRLMFAEAASPEVPYAATLIYNDPVADRAAIESAVKAGFLVRTRADSGGAESFAPGNAHAEEALASGAHIISTDYPAPTPAGSYHLAIPQGTPSRCNPLIAPPGCTPEAIESPAHLRLPRAPSLHLTTRDQATHAPARSGPGPRRSRERARSGGPSCARAWARSCRRGAA